MANDNGEEKTPPEKFSTIRQIQDLSPEELRSTPVVHVIGILKDYQTPMKSRGTDHKCTLEIVDQSIEGNTHGLKVNIFWPLDRMPQGVNGADIVIIRSIKAQMYYGQTSLLASHLSQFHVLRSESVPRSPKETKHAPWSCFTRQQNTVPSFSEVEYAMWLHKQKDNLDLPSDTEFRMKVEASKNARDKFRLSKELQDTGTMKGYADLIGQVVRIHDDGRELLEMYLTDYTANPQFYNYEWGGQEGEDRDDFGYLKAQQQSKKSNKWPGPFGKLSIQVGLWEPHASYAREHVKVGNWVLAGNVKIKIGKQGYLEGVIHNNDRVKVKVLEPSDEPLASESSSTEVRLQEAIERKYSWTKAFEKQVKAIRNEEAGSGNKRKRDDEEDIDPRQAGQTLNSKEKRKLERAAAKKKAQEDEVKKTKLQNLNQNIDCHFSERETTTIKQMLMPQSVLLQGNELDSPFTIAKYRANVRVVDYFPPRIEDFAVGSRSSEFDLLEEFSGLEDTDAEQSRKLWRSGQGHPKDKWEWRFALKVEDAESEGSGDTMWLIVDNSSAQMLLNLEDDATSLRNSPELLVQLKEQLFKLWGDLEERKSAALPKMPIRKSQNYVPSSPNNSMASSPPPRPGGDMPTSMDSDEENSELLPYISTLNSKRSALSERDANINTVMIENGEPPVAVKNKGFACCIQQYGVKVREEDESKANAGDGMRWQRMFGLIGTMIK